MPPIEPPTTQNSRSMPKWSISIAWARTMSRMVIDRQVEAVGLAGLRIDRGRAGRAQAAADHVGADDEEAVGVDDLARADQHIPPARLAGHRIGIGDMLVAGQRMADKDGVRARGVELAIGLVGDLEGRQQGAGVELQAACRRRTAAPGSSARWPRSSSLPHAMPPSNSPR